MVIRRNRMGDMICALPMLRQLRKSYPQAWIRVLCDREGEPLATASGLCDETIVLEKRGGRHRKILANARWVRGFDIVLAVKVGFDSLAASLAYLSCAPRRIGFVESSDPEIKEPFFYTDPVEKPREKEHQAVSCMRLIRKLNLPEGPYDFSIQIAPEYQRFADTFLRDNDLTSRRFCVVSVSTNQEDRWPLSHFAALCQCIRSEMGYDILVTSTPADRVIARDLVTLCADKWVMSVDTPGVLHLAALLSHARFVVAFEGGVAHLSTACGVPGVILWRKDAPFEKWKALSSSHRYVRGQPVADISVSEVLHAIGDVMEATMGEGAIGDNLKKDDRTGNTPGPAGA